MLYIALSPDQPPSLTFSTHPNRWFLLLTCLILLHFLTLHPQIKQSSSLWNSFVHLLTSLLRSPLNFCSSLSLCYRCFLPVFVCIGTHITGRIVFPIRIQFSISPPLPTVLSQYQFHVPPSRNNDLALMLLCSQLLHPCFSWGVAGKVGTYLTRARARSIKKRAFYLFHFATLLCPKRIHHANPVTRARCIVYLYSIYDLVYPSHYLC